MDGGGPDLVPIYQEHQPEAIVFQGPAASIRWIGNERGVAAYPCWATVPHRQDYQGPGDPEGRYWLPGEGDVPVRNHEWFWTPNAEQKLYSVEQLMDRYYRSVGRNGNLLRNAHPNPDGLVPEADWPRYVEFGREIRRRLAAPVAPTAGKGTLVELTRPRPAAIDQALVREDSANGERIREYPIEGRVGAEAWRTLGTGPSVGHQRMEQFDPVEVVKVRRRTLRAAAEPLIRTLAVYPAGGTLARRAVGFGGRPAAVPSRGRHGQRTSPPQGRLGRNRGPGAEVAGPRRGGRSTTEPNRGAVLLDLARRGQHRPRAGPHQRNRPPPSGRPQRR